jgi:hypothetical protein
MQLSFFETPVFTRYRPEYLDEENYRALQNSLLKNPEQGKLMPGTGGFRKMRWTDPRRGKGKRGGLRVIYYHLSGYRQIWLFTMYDKNEMADLSMEEKHALKSAIEAELAARQARKPT